MRGAAGLRLSASFASCRAPFHLHLSTDTQRKVANHPWSKFNAHGWSKFNAQRQCTAANRSPPCGFGRVAHPASVEAALRSSAPALACRIAGCLARTPLRERLRSASAGPARFERCIFRPWGAFRRCCQASMNALFAGKAKRKPCRKSFIELHLTYELRVG